MEWRPTQDGKHDIDDDFYDDFPKVKRGLDEERCLPDQQLDSPVNSPLRSSHAREDPGPLQDWKYRIGALVAGGLLTLFVPFGIVAGVALVACVHHLDRRQGTIEDAKPNAPGDPRWQELAATAAAVEHRNRRSLQ